MTIRIVSLLLLALACGSLQACFPVIVAGMGTGALFAQDRRDSKAILDDEKIEIIATKRIAEQIRPTTHINVTSYNRKVLITGEVPDDTATLEVGRIISSIKNVAGIHNELVLSANSSLASRSNDSLITADVKLRFIRDPRFESKQFNSNHIKVVTENGSVFLLGIVSQIEADAATDIASATTGVNRVVKLFEYLD